MSRSELDIAPTSLMKTILENKKCGILSNTTTPFEIVRAEYVLLFLSFTGSDTGSFESCGNNAFERNVNFIPSLYHKQLVGYNRELRNKKMNERYKIVFKKT